VIAKSSIRVRVRRPVTSVPAPACRGEAKLVIAVRHDLALAESGHRHGPDLGLSLTDECQQTLAELDLPQLIHEQLAGRPPDR
jgi:hypothetical protein